MMELFLGERNNVLPQHPEARAEASKHNMGYIINHARSA